MPPTFAQLGAPDFIVSALAQRGISQPFAIQAAAVADALAGRDVCGRAPTGSGKTLAFGIPLVASVGNAQPHRPRALVLAPTRELADQIMTELRTFAGKRRVGVAYGGVGYGPQIGSLRRGVDILVACPGRLEDLISQGEADLSAVDKVVIDEADRMADMGFIPAVRRLLNQTATKRQTMLFSATLDGDVATLTRDYQRDPVRHEVGDETPDVSAADHVFWSVARTDRTDICAEAIDAAGSTVVFCRTRHGCDRVARQLDRRGIRTAALHGGRSQSQRTRALAEFAAGKVQALVATDVAARGIHVEGVGAVVHYDIAADHKTYLHRSGRTARAGLGGVVVSLVQPEQVKELKSMQRKMGLEQPITEVDVAAIRSASPRKISANGAGFASDSGPKGSKNHKANAVSAQPRSEPRKASAGADWHRKGSQTRRRTLERPAAKHQSRHRRSNNNRSRSRGHQRSSQR
ncbi:DEAD/DEAH box helicase [Candidatus Poriferisodalis sp.]|uniref:DEAD/DEAH box helicase n=1 Tax=Candidatus Poriferisodalis sp. TaxID=3101277 RepID=UPI003B5A8791